MKVSVILHTSDYRGDHAADVEIAHDLLPGETVEGLVGRVLGDEKPHDFLTLRIVQEPRPEEPR